METNQPNTPEALTQEQIAQMMQSPELQALIDNRAQAVAREAAKLAVWNDKEDIIPDYQTGRTGYGNNEKFERTSVALTEDDERFLNRNQPESEDIDALQRNATSNMDMLFSEPDEFKERPLIAIARDLAGEKSQSKKGYYKITESKLDNPEAKSEFVRKKSEAVDQSRLVDLKDELAINLVADSASQDEKLNKLIAVQERAGLSEDEISDVLESITNYENMLITTANLSDEVIQNQVVPTMQKLVDNNEAPFKYFTDEKGKKTAEFKKLDAALTEAITVENPLLRKLAVTEINKQLTDTQRKFEAELTEKKAVEAQAKAETEAQEKLLSYEDALEEAYAAHGTPAEPKEPILKPRKLKIVTKEEADEAKEAEAQEAKLAEAINGKAAEHAKYWINLGQKAGDSEVVTSDALTKVKQEGIKYRKGEITKVDGLSYLESADGQAMEKGYFLFLVNKHTKDDKFYSNLDNETYTKVKADEEAAITKDLETFKMIANRAENGTRLGNAFRSLRGKIRRNN